MRRALRGLKCRTHASVEHRDARCVAADDVCAFSLVRLLCGFRVTPARGAAAAALAALRGADASWDEDRDDGSVLCKGEGVDVSFPKRLDVNLALWAEGERDAPGSFVSRATLAAGGRATSILCESLDALILEQRDLTFGKRAQHLVIWRVAKSAKRLRRLVELLGARRPAHRDAHRPRAAVDAADRVGLDAAELARCDALFASSLVDASLVRPLEHLALRAFGDAADLALPPNFAAKWDAVLAPLVSLVDTFAGAAAPRGRQRDGPRGAPRSTTSTSAPRVGRLKGWLLPIVHGEVGGAEAAARVRRRFGPSASRVTTASSGVGAARIASSFASTRWSAAVDSARPAAPSRARLRSRGDSGLGGAGFSGDAGGSGGATRSSGRRGGGALERRPQERRRAIAAKM
ncbi:hypothetical protein SO694_00018259 [Aureococcus anophagefferens]|uniref:Uncharacterized protein n=1 Tax=Aureococcus anophagefferens TaxID=44056 RepID=A0ABR1G0T7_AURAN